MFPKENVMELEIDGVLVEKLTVWGEFHMKQLIEEYTKMYNLDKKRDNYAFFIYRRSAIVRENFEHNLLHQLYEPHGKSKLNGHEIY